MSGQPGLEVRSQDAQANADRLRVADSQLTRQEMAAQAQRDSMQLQLDLLAQTMSENQSFLELLVDKLLTHAPKSAANGFT